MRTLATAGTIVALLAALGAPDAGATGRLRKKPAEPASVSHRVHWRTTSFDGYIASPHDAFGEAERVIAGERDAQGGRMPGGLKSFSVSRNHEWRRDPPFRVNGSWGEAAPAGALTVEKARAALGSLFDDPGLVAAIDDAYLVRRTSPTERLEIELSLRWPRAQLADLIDRLGRNPHHDLSRLALKVYGEANPGALVVYTRETPGVELTFAVRAPGKPAPGAPVELVRRLEAAFASQIGAHGLDPRAFAAAPDGTGSLHARATSGAAVRAWAAGRDDVRVVRWECPRGQVTTECNANVTIELLPPGRTPARDPRVDAILTELFALDGPGVHLCRASFKLPGPVLALPYFPADYLARLERERDHTIVYGTFELAPDRVEALERRVLAVAPGAHFDRSPGRIQVSVDLGTGR